MFLAWNEIRYEKTRFFLIIAVVLLISSLVFFLTGLAYGLASSYSQAIHRWESDAIVYGKESNDNLSMSMLRLDDLAKVEAEAKAPLATFPAIVRKTEENKDENSNAVIFAIDPESFLAPEVVEGRLFAADDEITADLSLKEEGFALGDRLYFAGKEPRFAHLVGFTKNASFQVSPVLYSSFDFFSQYRFNQRFESLPLINAIVARGASIQSLDPNFKVMGIQAFIFTLPGYMAQVLTFGLMIGFLILISALIIGIFIYVLTIQKVNMFGVMKAQGIPNRVIAAYVLWKTLLVTGIGVFLGLGLVLLGSLLLPAAVPFLIQAQFYLAICVLFLFFASLGALFSVRMVSKIDPLTALRQ